MVRMLTNEAGVIKKVKQGFSWTLFFFGRFVPLLRGDFKYFGILAIITVITESAGKKSKYKNEYNLFNTIYLVGIVVGIIAHIILSFIYNGIYTDNLLKKGYKFTDNLNTKNHIK